MSTSTALLCAALAILAAGCNGGGDNTTPAGGGSQTNATSGGTKKYTIAVIPKGQTHEYWKSVHEGAQKAADELGDVEISWKGPEKENDRDEQIKLVEDFITTQGISGIVLAPLDDQALGTPIQDAIKANIPVVVIDSGVKTSGYLSYVATDNYKGGVAAGDYLAKLLNDKGNVIMMRYEEGSASTDQREQGFMDAMKKYPNMKVVSSDQYGHESVETATTTAESLIGAHKKGEGLDIDGIYTPNESTTMGMLQTLRNERVAGKVKFVGFDVSAKLLDGLNKGDIDGLIIQDPRQMGYKGVKFIEQYLKDPKANIPKNVDTGATLLTKENETDPKVAALIAPPQVKA